MKKAKFVPKPEPRIADGVSVRVRFASHKQLELIKAAARHKGIPRDLYIQRVLQASAEAVLAAPPDPAILQVATDANAQL